MGITKLLPDYIVETNFSKADDATKVEMIHFYSTSKWTVWLFNFYIKRKIARQTQDTLDAMKRSIEAAADD